MIIDVHLSLIKIQTWNIASIYNVVIMHRILIIRVAVYVKEVMKHGMDMYCKIIQTCTAGIIFEYTKTNFIDID